MVTKGESMAVIFELRQAGLRFGSFAALTAIDLKVMEGETLILLGPNGAGKTCVLRLLAGLLPPSSGLVLRPGTEARPARLGYCPQAGAIWENLTVAEQLALAAAMYGVDKNHARERSAALLEEYRLTGEEHTLGRELSRGNRRKLNLVLSLVHEPDVLLLDEPEAELDAPSRAALVQSLLKLAKAGSTTMVISTHHQQEAEQLASRVTTLDAGRIVS
jgi:ABC-2 type transport system ATP-binding protein